MSNKPLNLAQQPDHNPDEPADMQASPNPAYADEELVRRAKTDDSWAIEQLVLRYQQKIYAIAYQMLAGDAEEARDRTQDVFLQAFRSIKRFQGKSSFYTWLYRIAINTCIDARRRQNRWKKIFFSWRFDSHKDKAPDHSTPIPMLTLWQRPAAGN